MDAFNPFKLAAFWTGMALGIPMLATELAAEVWGTKPKPAPAPVEKAVAAGDYTNMSDRTFRGSEADVAAIREAFFGVVPEPRWVVPEPVVLEPGRIEELPPGFVAKPATLREIECQTGPFPAPKPRKRKS